MTNEGPSTEPRERAGGIAVGLGPAAAVLLAGVLSGAREWIGTTNIALVLACVVVLAAVAGRGAGAATAVVAAISFNFFHTVPYQSLRIDDGQDTLTVVLLAVIGIVVSETAHRRRRALESSRSHIRGERALEVVAARLSQGAGAEAVWSGVESSLVELLDLAECRFEAGEVCTLPILPRTGSLLSNVMHLSRFGFELPESGAALKVEYGSRTYGHILLVPNGRRGSSAEARRVAVALADQYAVALALGRVVPGR